MTTFVQANENEEFYGKVRASGVVNDDESILLSSNVYYYPNKKGHGLFSGGKGREKGHIVFTENGFSVISWSRRDKTYEVLHSENYSELASTDVSGNSPMVRLVTESKTTGKYNSFELMDSRNALTPNVNKTKEARKLVTAGIQGLDVKEIATVKDLSSVEVAMQKQKMDALEERIQRLENANTPSQSVESECDCKCDK
ncbi:MAG: hypothetical protein R8G33_09005 [Gammaproteobacteria bacterium]|nr:hypothetical protein [Gammaproteobacteria bacterium]